LAKRNFGRELWERMRLFVADSDGLPEYECGDWTFDKLYFLCSYLAQTTQAMVGHPKFRSINYVDLFCGPGVCVEKGASDASGRYPGSAILAAGCEKPFNKIILCDKDPRCTDAVTSRVGRLGCKSSLKMFTGNSNDLIGQISNELPPRSLNVAFVDPYSLDVHYSTIEALANHRPLDLLILFADDIDLLRNVKSSYYPNPASKLDQFLGAQSNWRREWDELQVREASKVRDLFSRIYLRQLASIGYQFSATRPIPITGRPLYRLVFASKNELGLKFWRIAESETRGGERNLFGGY
jgi:three-Cys-motif partner protein